MDEKKNPEVELEDEPFETSELEDEDLDDVAGGVAGNTGCNCNCGAN